MPPAQKAVKLQRLRHYIDTLCGLYSRIARRLGVDRTYVSKVARGERHSPDIEDALLQDFEGSQRNEPR
jgi:transcriptional regulator with XRE-family HTH domain